ncbi:hypothetical protein Tco_0987193 [Tanacetum coccineum]
MNEHPDIPKRLHDNYHRVENDDRVKIVFNSGKNKDGAGMKIPDWMLTAEMKLTKHYKMRQASEPPTPVPKAAEQNVAIINEHLADTELDELLNDKEIVDEDAFVDDILNSQEDPGTRIKTRSDKESPDTMNDADMVHVDVNEEEEESAEEKLERIRREKGKGIEDTRTSPPPTPIRSPRIHTEDALLSTDKEKLQELTVLDSIPSSSTPTSLKPRIGRLRKNKTFLQLMGGYYGYLFGHLKQTFMTKKTFHLLSEKLESTLREVLPSMVNKEINKIAKTTVPVYMERENLWVEKQDLSIWLSLKIKFENITNVAACRPFAIRLRDHDDYQDDDARPEGENSTKRQKTLEQGTYHAG